MPAASIAASIAPIALHCANDIFIIFFGALSRSLLFAVIPGRAEGAIPESIIPCISIIARQGLWIPALASLGRNDGKGSSAP
jgi:hypothetical protein